MGPVQALPPPQIGPAQMGPQSPIEGFDCPSGHVQCSRDTAAGSANTLAMPTRGSHGASLPLLAELICKASVELLGGSVAQLA